MMMPVWEVTQQDDRMYSGGKQPLKTLLRSAGYFLPNLQTQRPAGPIIPPEKPYDLDYGHLEEQPHCLEQAGGRTQGLQNGVISPRQHRAIL